MTVCLPCRTTLVTIGCSVTIMIDLEPSSIYCAVLWRTVLFRMLSFGPCALDQYAKLAVHTLDTYMELMTSARYIVMLSMYNVQGTKKIFFLRQYTESTVTSQKFYSPELPQNSA